MTFAAHAPKKQNTMTRRVHYCCRLQLDAFRRLQPPPRENYAEKGRGRTTIKWYSN